MKKSDEKFIKEKIEVFNIKLGSRTIPVILHWRNRLTLGLSVGPEARVDAFIPKRARRQDVESFLRKKAPWIIGALERQESFIHLPWPSHYASGEKLAFLGRQYQLRVLAGQNGAVKLNGDFLEVPSTSMVNGSRQVQRAVELWYRRQAEEVFHDKLQTSYLIANRHGVQEAELKIRKMKRRWGSCHEHGLITLNLHLVQTPIPCIEYVIMHELCHRLHANHGREFYSLLARCMPDWHQRKQALDCFVIQVVQPRQTSLSTNTT